MDAELEASALEIAWTDGDSGPVWDEVKAIRQRVFVEEQACPPDEEWDAHEATSRHLVGRRGGRAIACARWRVAEVDGEPWAKLERFAVLPEERGGGLGRRLVEIAMADARAHGHRRFRLHAQAHLEAFYRSLGFAATAHRFVEAGIPHLLMVRVEDGGG